MISFQFYDNNADGEIKSTDIEEVITKILPCKRDHNLIKCECLLRKEVKKIADEYV